jgi:hypothetical protein
MKPSLAPLLSEEFPLRHYESNLAGQGKRRAASRSRAGIDLAVVIRGFLWFWFWLRKGDRALLDERFVLRESSPDGLVGLSSLFAFWRIRYKLSGPARSSSCRLVNWRILASSNPLVFVTASKSFFVVPG